MLNKLHSPAQKIFDTNTGDLLVTLLGHTGSVFCCCCGADSIHIATTSFDRTAKIWGSQIGQISDYRAHSPYFSSFL